MVVSGRRRGSVAPVSIDNPPVNATSAPFREGLMEANQAEVEVTIRYLGPGLPFGPLPINHQPSAPR